MPPGDAGEHGVHILSPVVQEQQRNLKALGLLLAAVVLLAALAAWYLYTGVELPPYEMRHYYTSSTGYAPPPSKGPSPAGTISRGSALLSEPILTTAAPATVGYDHAMTPPEADRLVNPSKPDAVTMTLGKAQFDANCRMCHGAPGEGIGSVGEAYTPKPPNLRDHAAHHSDGALFYLITNGIRSTPTPETARYLPDEWHSFRDLMTPRERWATATYVRSYFGGR